MKKEIALFPPFLLEEIIPVYKHIPFAKKLKRDIKGDNDLYIQYNFIMKHIRFGVSEKKEKEVFEKMKNLGIKEEDMIEKFILSSGKGGQKVNKSSSCVYLKHIPTGIEVKCQKTRFQSLNRFFARRILIEKIEEKLLGKKSEFLKKKLKKIKQKKKKEKRARKKYHEVIPHG